MGFQIVPNLRTYSMLRGILYCALGISKLAIMTSWLMKLTCCVISLINVFGFIPTNAMNKSIPENAVVIPKFTKFKIVDDLVLAFQWFDLIFYILYKQRWTGKLCMCSARHSYASGTDFMQASRYLSVANRAIKIDRYLLYGRNGLPTEFLYSSLESMNWYQTNEERHILSMFCPPDFVQLPCFPTISLPAPTNRQYTLQLTHDNLCPSNSTHIFNGAYKLNIDFKLEIWILASNQ